MVKGKKSPPPIDPEEDDEKMAEEDPVPDIDSDSDSDSEHSLSDKEIIDGDPGVDATAGQYDEWIKTLKRPFERYLAKQVKNERLGLQGRGGNAVVSGESVIQQSFDTTSKL